MRLTFLYKEDQTNSVSANLIIMLTTDLPIYFPRVCCYASKIEVRERLCHNRCISSAEFSLIVNYQSVIFSYSYGSMYTGLTVFAVPLLYLCNKMILSAITTTACSTVMSK